MARKLLEDENFKISYQDKDSIKGKETLIIKIKKTKDIIEITKEGIVNATKEET